MLQITWGEFISHLCLLVPCVNCFLTVNHDTIFFSIGFVVFLSFVFCFVLLRYFHALKKCVKKNGVASVNTHTLVNNLLSVCTVYIHSWWFDSNMSLISLPFFPFLLLGEKVRGIMKGIASTMWQCSAPGPSCLRFFILLSCSVICNYSQGGWQIY